VAAGFATGTGVITELMGAAAVAVGAVASGKAFTLVPEVIPGVPGGMCSGLRCASQPISGSHCSMSSRTWFGFISNRPWPDSAARM
jgi:hypothetical protein